MRTDVAILIQMKCALQQRQRRARHALAVFQPALAVQDGRIIRFGFERRGDQLVGPAQFPIVIGQYEAERVADRAILRALAIERLQLPPRGVGTTGFLQHDGLLVQQIGVPGKSCQRIVDAGQRLRALAVIRQQLRLLTSASRCEAGARRHSACSSCSASARWPPLYRMVAARLRAAVSSAVPPSS
jgi:hypothetical protein